MPPQMRRHLDKAFPYPPGRPIEEVQREYGLKSVVKLASNENPLGPSPKAVAAMKKHAKDMHYYPDGNVYYLRQALADKLKVKPEQLIFGAGSDDISTFIMTCFAGNTYNIVCSEHTFIRYEQTAIITAANVKRAPMFHWRHDISALHKLVNKKTGVIAVANPDNPVGCAVSKKETEQLLRGAPASTLILYDQAYYEYCEGRRGYPNGVEYARKKDNVICTRTFSKAYGLAGLRIGYAVASPEIIECLNRVRPPFNVNRMAQEAALAALEDDTHMRRTREVNEQGLDYLQRQFERMGLEYLPSAGNFISFNVQHPCADVFQELLKRGVIVRPLAGYGMPTWLRVSVGLPKENEAFVNALKPALRHLAQTEAAAS